ncbi:MAG: HigA family addiction module antitoxin [Deltaproteobacteria bacterium]|nr:HigA family addiction module antitoxin [Deltaproteobacteria bacterium]
MKGRSTTNTQAPGEYVREKILHPNKMSVTEAAKVLGVGRPAFSNFLNNNASLSPNMAARIERAFGIPAQKLHDIQAAYDAAQAKAKGAPANTNSYVPPFLEIVANEIEDWASNIAARPRLSVLLRTLVNSTGIGLTKVDFPGNDDAERPGWDGFVMTTEGTPWIPEGQSGWEFGCNQVPKAKADKDYAKSTKSVGKSDRDNTTFVFVSPRRWPSKGKWVAERKAEGQWKDVRAYDASDLEQWLEQSVAGQTWFSSEAQRASNGTRSLDKCWTDWSEVAHPPLAGVLFKTAVEGAKKTVASKLAKPPEEPLVIAADSTEEAVAFLAQLFSDAGEELAGFRDRVVIFDEPGILPKLAAGSSNFIAVATTREVERELGPFCRSVHTIVVYPRNAINTEPHVLLEPLNYEAFRTGLESMACDHNEIDRLDHESGRSLTVLRRRLSTIPAVKMPVWAAKEEVAASLVPFLFAGAWGSANQCDQVILSLLANDTAYVDLEKRLQELAQLNDSPVWSVGTYRGVVSKIDLLFAISGTITKPELEAYFSVAQLVLSEDDPSLDLPEKDRWAAGVYGKTREISGALRRGVCETLVLLAVHGNSLFQKKLGVNVEAMAIRLIRELLGDPLTTRILEAHDRDLPTYAEVAPDEFLKILEKDLKADNPASFGLMRPADSGIFGGCARTGLLWALENLAWSPSTLTRAVLILAKLAEIKIEDNWVNKPISSLKDIFRSWMPQTAASLDERIAVIELLAARYPKIAWQICMDQFGETHQMGSYNHKPRWRNDAQGYGEVVTVGERCDFVVKMVDMALNWKVHDRSTISDLIQRLHDLDDPRQETVWNIVKNWAGTASDLDKAWIREKIRVTVMSRRGVARTKRRKTDKLDAAAKAAYAALEPTDILSKHEWLFRDIWVEESFDEIHDEDFDYRKRDERIRNLRSDALQTIMNERGIEGILALAEMGKTPGQIGDLLVTKILSPKEITDFVLAVVTPEEKAATWTYKSLAMGAIRSIGDDLSRTKILNKMKKVLPLNRFIKLLELAPFRTTTWSLVKALDESSQKAYWASVSPTWEQQSDDELNELVEQLLIAKRPRVAFSCVHFTLEKLRPALLFKLMEALAIGNDETDGHYQPQYWDIEKAFQLLDASASFSIEQMAGLELTYVEVLARSWDSKEHRGIPNIEKYMDTHPEFYAQVVAWIYKRGDGGIDPEAIRLDNPEYVQNRATRGHKIIEGLQRIPGRDKQGDINADLLLGWVNAVRKSCAELGRQDVGDLSLGKLFSEAPKGADGVWPCEPVRQVLEQIQSEKISDGITVGLYNSRGIHARGEGGDQERELAAMYREWASALEFSHPFVAATILRDLASTYEREAQREDTEAGIRRRLR